MKRYFDQHYTVNVVGEHKGRGMTFRAALLLAHMFASRGATCEVIDTNTGANCVIVHARGAKQ